MAARGGGTRIGGIIIDVLGNTGSLQQSLKDADRAAAKFARGFKTQWNSATSSIDSAASTILSVKSALLGMAGAAGIGALVKQTLDYADSIAEASDALGLTTKAYQELSFAASQSGIGQDKFTASFSKFVRLAESAALGEKGPAAVFTRLGISAKEAGGDVEALVTLVVQQIDKIPTQSERLKIIGELFGAKVAAKWAATFAEGSSGLARMRQLADEMGLVLEDRDIRGFAKLADQVEAVGAKLKIAFARGLFEGMTGQTGELVDLLQDPATGKAIDGLAESLRSVAAIIGDVLVKAKELYPYLKTLAEHPLAIAGGLTGAAALGPRGFVVGAAAGFAEDERRIRAAHDSRPAAGMEGPPLPPGYTNTGWATLPTTTVTGARPLGANAATSEESAAAKRKEQIDKFVASLRAEVAGLVLEANAIGQSAAAQQEAAIQKELAITLTDKEIDATKDAGRALEIEGAIREKYAAINNKAVAEMKVGLDAEIVGRQEQIDALGKTTEARERDAVITKLLADAQARGVVIDEKALAVMREKATALGELAGLAEDAEKMRGAFEAAGQSISSAFESAIFEGGKLSDVIEGLIQDLARLALRQLIFSPFVEALGNWGATIGGAGARGSARGSAIGPRMSYGAAAAVSPQSVNVNVYTQPGQTARTQSRAGMRGTELDIIVEAVTRRQTEQTMRGGGFRPMFESLSRGLVG